MITRLYIWVTSDCNLTCKWCSQKHTISLLPGYQMSCGEVERIINSCNRRGLHFDIIDLTGGEPSLWQNLKYGVKRFGEIANEITLVTNGNNPELIKSLNLKRFIVSASQATKEQLKHYEGMDNVKYNEHSHKKLPEKPFDNVLPAACCVSVEPFSGLPQTVFAYVSGKVFYCCDAVAHTQYAGITDDIYCDFEDDFISKFYYKSFDKEICRYCLCNGKIWPQI